MNNRRIDWSGVAFGLSLAVLAAYQQFKLPPALPELLDRYGHGRTLAGGYMSVYALAGFVLSMRVGGLMQRYGPSRFLYGAFVLFAVAILAMLAVPENGVVFLIARAIEGVGFAVLAIAGPALCNRAAGPAGLAIVAALIATWIPLGSLIANGLAIGLGEAGSWRALWWAGLAGVAGMAIWTAWRTRGERLDFATVGAADSAAVEDGTTVRRRVRAEALSATVFMLWSLQLFAFLTWFPEYLVETRSLDLRGAVLGYTVPIATIAVFNLVAAPLLAAGIRVSLLLAAATGIQAAIWFILPGATGFAGFAGLVVYGMAAGITPTCLFALPATILGIDRAGPRAVGVLMTGRNLGVLVGPVAMAALVDTTGGWDTAAPTFGLVAALAAAGALTLDRLLAARA